MRNIFRFLVLFVLSILYVPYSYSQNVEKESFLSVYIANDFSRTMYHPISIYDDTDTYTKNHGFTPVFGLNVKLVKGFYGSLRAGGYSIWETLNDNGYNISIRNYMVGFKMKDTDHPFFVTLLAGLNTVDYQFEGIDDDFLPINKSFVLGVNAGLRIFRTKRLSYDLSVGYNKSFDKDLPTNKIYFQLSIPIEIIYK